VNRLAQSPPPAPAPHPSLRLPACSNSLHSTPSPLQHQTPLLHSSPLTGSIYILHNPSANLQGPDTPAHTDNTSSHSHPSGGSSESSINRLNPRTGSIASPVVIDGDSSRDDGTVDGSLVLLVWHNCSSGDGDGWLCWWTDISLFYLEDVEKTYAVLLAVQVASIQFPSPGSYQSIRQQSLMRKSRQPACGSPHGWTVGLDGLTDVTKWTVD
jgi:hypothetical protein